MAHQENLKFNHTFQGIEFANGICSFHYIFYIVFYLRKLFYAPCVSDLEANWINPLILRTTIRHGLP